MIYLIAGAFVACLLLAVALCVAARRGDEIARMRDEYMDWWEG